MKIEPMINRSVVLVVGKKPYYDWSNAIFPDSEPTTMESINEHNSYLIEDDMLFDNPKVALKKYWKTMFENELFDMSTDPEDWPELSWSLFTKWFDVHFSSLVRDLSDDELHLMGF